MELSKKEVSNFQKIIWGYYKEHRRKFPWRNLSDSYHVFISEMMLQQTQVSRVCVKYSPFIKQFPNARVLARAPFSAVLSAWSGLGYNRRAQFLHETAKIIVKKYGGKFPRDIESLIALPGIGPGTAGAIFAFAYNKPVVFIETNIRSVFIYFFFKQKKSISDKEIISLIAQTLDQKSPRHWYCALMDYGVMLKEKYPNPSRKSAHYIKQPSFHGSRRQVRGEILKLLVMHKSISAQKIKKQVHGDMRFVSDALQQLRHEGFIEIKKRKISLAV